MVATVGERLSGPDRNSLQLNVHCLTRVVSLSEQFHDEILRKIALRHVTANIWQVPWLLIDICYRLKRARNEEDVNSSGQDVPMVFEFSHEAAQIVPTVDLAVLQEHDAVSVSRVRVQSFVSNYIEPVESRWHLSVPNFPRLSDYRILNWNWWRQ